MRATLIVILLCLMGIVCVGQQCPDDGCPVCPNDADPVCQDGQWVCPCVNPQPSCPGAVCTPNGTWNCPCDPNTKPCPDATCKSDGTWDPSTCTAQCDPNTMPCPTATCKSDGTWDASSCCDPHTDDPCGTCGTIQCDSSCNDPCACSRDAGKGCGTCGTIQCDNSCEDPCACGPDEIWCGDSCVPAEQGCSIANPGMAALERALANAAPGSRPVTSGPRLAPLTRGQPPAQSIGKPVTLESLGRMQ